LARRTIDHQAKGKGLKPEELAALARVSRKTVMNLLAPSTAAKNRLKLDARGLIPIKASLSWLMTRPDFRPSIMQTFDDHVAEPEPDKILEGAFVFVPVTDDGTWFSPA